jgi:hypothetical protein
MTTDACAAAVCGLSESPELDCMSSHALQQAVCAEDECMSGCLCSVQVLIRLVYASCQTTTPQTPADSAALMVAAAACFLRSHRLAAAAAQAAVPGQQSAEKMALQ